jgi:hypothetical protein
LEELEQSYVEVDSYVGLPGDDLALEEIGMSRIYAAIGSVGVTAWSGPDGLLDVIRRAESPERLESTGGVTLRVALPAPEETQQHFDEPLPVPVVEVDLQGEIPTAIRLVVEDGPDRLRIDVKLSNWNAPVDVTPPDESDIDPTPWIDEEAVAAVAATLTPVWPTVVPDGLELSYLDAVPVEDTIEGCAQLNVGYAPPFDPTVDAEAIAGADDYLDLYLMPASCALAYNDTPFTPGRYGETLSRASEGGWDVLFGDTVVQIDSSLGEAELASVVASLAPFDLNAEIAALNARMEAEGGWFG